MTRIVLSTLILLFISSSAAGAQAQITLDEGRRYEAEEQIKARVENTGTQPITMCVEIGQWSFNKSDVEATPTPFRVEQRTDGKWHALLLAPDLGSYLHAEVLGVGKSVEFPFRLNSPGTTRLMVNYWLGSKSDLDCRAESKGSKQVVSPIFSVGSYAESEVFLEKRVRSAKCLYLWKCDWRNAGTVYQ
jgi:hypothetical protein